MTINCEVGDIVKITWIDVGCNHDYYSIENIEKLMSEFRKEFTTITYGEVVYHKDNEIVVAYTRNERDARTIYLRKELIKSIEVLVPEKSL